MIVKISKDCNMNMFTFSTTQEVLDIKNHIWQFQPVDKPFWLKVLISKKPLT